MENETQQSRVKTAVVPVDNLAEEKAVYTFFSTLEGIGYVGRRQPAGPGYAEVVAYFAVRS